LRELLTKIADGAQISFQGSGEAFLSKDQSLGKIIQNLFLYFRELRGIKFFHIFFRENAG
jgi:hypothetical protein